MIHRRRTLLLGMAATSLLPLVPALAQTATARTATAQAPSAAEQSLLDAESALFQAQLRGDVSAVRQAMAPGLAYIHNNGMMQTKDEYMHMLEGGLHYKTIDPSQRTASVFGDFGVTHGILAQDTGNGHQSVGRYTGVYLRREGRWQLLSWQTTPMTPAPQGAPPAGSAR